MLSFREVTLSDITSIKEFFKNAASQSCDVTFGNLFLWQQQFSQRVCIYKDTLFLRYGEEYLFPIGALSVKESIELLMLEAKERNVPFKMKLLTEKQCELLKENFPNRFSFKHDLNNSDYIYTTENMITLSGKKYHSKRNHISKFDRMYNWEYELISVQNIVQCIEMNKKWDSENDYNDENLIREKVALKLAFEHFLELGLVGGVLKVDGEVVAYSIGEAINETTFCTHFEKALSDFEGAYAKMNNLFSKNELSSYEFINREEDMGIEGLRKAKSSYNPTYILNKYSATLI